jgi:ApbE superfamily uncharacterized protein (UPF0280 family)
MSRPARAFLPDGRLHLQHGPVDLVIEAWGAREEVEAVYEQAWARFQDVLDALVAELPLLRAPVGGAVPLARGPVAHRMVAAVWPHREVFITPMAAVAGAVADEILAAAIAGRALEKAYVNDGGDIALHLEPGQHFDTGIVSDPRRPALDASLRIEWRDPVRGIATSGWRGRSQSLGIADAVTVLASNAAAADAAATLVANAVNVAHPAIRRRPARELKLDSDLGDLPVTVDVGPLPRDAVEEALDAGLSVARSLRERGLLAAAFLSLQGRTRVLAGGGEAAALQRFETPPIRSEMLNNNQYVIHRSSPRL